MSIRVSLFLALLLLLFSSSFLHVARCESEPEEDVETTEEGVGDLGIVGDGAQDFDGADFNPAPGVETVCVFPKNPSKLIVAGAESELLVGVKNDGEASIKVHSIYSSVHLPYDHKYLIQNLTTQVFNNASIPPSAQAAFPYVFAVSKFLQSGTYDLVGTIVYEIDQYPYQNTFFNGTFEVAEKSDLLTVESVLLLFFGVALIGLLGLWIRGQIQNLSKKTKRAPKVEVGTRASDTSMDEWLEGTAFTQSQSNKSKKKK